MACRLLRCPDSMRAGDRPLAIDDIAVGLEACARNAVKLAEDAGRLFSRKRYSTALFLGIASLEESGKAYLLITMAAAKNTGVPIDWGTFWTRFRSHSAKAVLASAFDLGVHGREASQLAILALFFEELPRIRERALYVDFESGRWLTPDNSLRGLAAEVLDAAEALSELLSREFNPRRHQVLLKDLRVTRLPLLPQQNPTTRAFLEGIEGATQRLHRTLGKANIPSQPQFN